MQRLFVIDASVFIAGLITRDAASFTARILSGMLDGQLAYLLSPALLHEYRVVLLRPKLQRLHGLANESVDALLTEVVANAMWRDPVADSCHAAPDPEDGHLRALLAHEPTAVLVTGNCLLLENPQNGELVDFSGPMPADVVGLGPVHKPSLTPRPE